MPVKTIPAKYLHECEFCGASQVTETAWLPYRWGKVVIERRARDWNLPEGIGGGLREWYLCDRCQVSVEAWMVHQQELKKDQGVRAIPVSPSPDVRQGEGPASGSEPGSS